METSYLILSAAVLVAAAIVAFALRRSPAAPVEAVRDPRLDAVIAQQGEIAGQFRQTVEAQSALQKMMAERIDALNTRLGETLSESATKTAATISSIGERLT